MKELLEKHIKDDMEQFIQIKKRFDDQDIVLKDIKDFMQNLSGINDAVKGVGLLKNPMLWILAFVIGIVTLFGGLKTILGWFGINILK